MGESTELARRLALLRREKRAPKTCPVCGSEFVAIPGQKYCGPRCRNRAGWRAWWRRKKASESGPAPDANLKPPS